MKKDLSSRLDIELLVQTFYNRLLEDAEMDVLFNQVVKIDLVAHLPIICDFWESTLFHTGSYRNNTMEKHLSLHQKHPLNAELFHIWLTLFNDTVDELFTGTKASLAKTRAHSIAQIMQYKINHHGNDHFLA